MLEKEIHAEEVAEYLNQNRQFFHLFPDLLNELSVPHPKTGDEISLLERQVYNLRQQKEILQAAVDGFQEIAGENGILLQKVMAFALALMRTKDEQQAVEVIYQQMSEVFQVPYVTLFSWEVPNRQVVGLPQLGMSQKWLQILKQHLSLMEPLCGEVEAAWQSGLFPLVSDSVGSTCLVPLGEKRVWGVLALGCEQSERFHESQDTYFLKLMGQMVSTQLDGLFTEKAI